MEALLREQPSHWRPRGPHQSPLEPLQPLRAQRAIAAAQAGGLAARGWLWPGMTREAGEGAAQTPCERETARGLRLRRAGPRRQQRSRVRHRAGFIPCEKLTVRSAAQCVSTGCSGEGKGHSSAAKWGRDAWKAHSSPLNIPRYEESVLSVSPSTSRSSSYIRRT